MCKNYVEICCETRAIYAPLVYVAKTNYALLKQMLRKKPTHFIRKVFAQKVNLLKTKNVPYGLKCKINHIFLKGFERGGLTFLTMSENFFLDEPPSERLQKKTALRGKNSQDGRPPRSPSMGIFSSKYRFFLKMSQSEKI